MRKLKLSKKKKNNRKSQQRKIEHTKNRIEILKKRTEKRINELER